MALCASIYVHNLPKLKRPWALPSTMLMLCRFSNFGLRLNESLKPVKTIQVLVGGVNSKKKHCAFFKCANACFRTI